MGDVHQLPPRGRDLPEAPRRKAQVWSFTVDNYRYWAWSHVCLNGRAAESGHATWAWAFWCAEVHLGQCA